MLFSDQNQIGCEGFEVGKEVDKKRGSVVWLDHLINDKSRVIYGKRNILKKAKIPKAPLVVPVKSRTAG